MLSSILFAAASALSASAASLQQINGISPNPNNVGFYSYVPANLAQPPPLIVALHYCSGTAQAYYTGTQYASLADQHGYILIYPNAPRSGGCWDVNTQASLTHNGGSDSIAIAASVSYAIKTWGVDPNRVYVTGSSSGAMMTSVLLGAYPDVFKAGVSYSGVAYGCFAGSSAWNSQCAQGQLIKTAQQWGDLVRNAYPGYTGSRPAYQIWHGTADTTLYTQNFWEEIKQWTNVDGYSQTPISNVTNSPQSGYSTATYGPLFQAILAQGVGHGVPEHATNTLDFFGLSNLKPGKQTTTTTVPHTSTPATTSTKTNVGGTTTTSSANGATQTKYGQCGGQGWTGPTVCVSGSTCVYSNDYYSQCT